MNPYEVGPPDQKNYYFDTQHRFTFGVGILPGYFRYVKDQKVMLETIDQIYDKEKNEFYIGIYQFTIAFNKYIFHNDAASFSWLLHFNPYMLSNLVLSFSYEEAPLLNG